MSEKRLLGWEPVEVQEHEYNEDGRMVRTVVTREPEWDDLERAKMEGLALYEAELCDCGLHISVADSDPALQIIERHCPICAGVEKAKRVIEAKDAAALKALGDPAPPKADHPGDGRHFGLKFKQQPSLTD